MSDKTATDTTRPFKKGDKHPPTDPDDSATKSYRKVSKEPQLIREPVGTSQLSSVPWDNFALEDYWYIPNGNVVKGNGYIEIQAHLYRPYSDSATKFNFYNRYNNVNLSIEFHGASNRFTCRSWDSSHGWHDPTSHDISNYIYNTGPFTLKVYEDDEDSSQLVISIVQDGSSLKTHHKYPDGSWTAISYAHYAGDDGHQLFEKNCQIRYLED